MMTTQANCMEDCCDVKRLNTDRIETILRSGKLESCGEMLDAFFREMRFDELESLMLRLYVGMDIYIVSRSFSRELGISNDEFMRSFGSIDEISKHLQTAQDSMDFFRGLVTQCIRWRIASVNENGNDIVRKARE